LFRFIEFALDLARRESIDELHSHQNTKKKKKKKASAKGDVEDDDVTKWRSIGSETSTSFGYQSISPDRKNSVESRYCCIGAGVGVGKHFKIGGRDRYYAQSILFALNA
jgi:hypothetical protein